MCDHHHGHVVFGQFLHGFQHFACELGVEGRSGLVKQHDVGLHRQGTGNGDTLFLTARQLRWVIVVFFSQTDFGEQFVRQRQNLLFAHFFHRHRRFNDVLYHRHVWEQIELLKHHAHFAAQGFDFFVGFVLGEACGIAADHGLAFNRNAAAIDGFQMV